MDSDGGGGLINKVKAEEGTGKSTKGKTHNNIHARWSLGIEEKGDNDVGERGVGIEWGTGG